MQEILKKLRFVGQKRVLVMHVPGELSDLPRALLDAEASVETIPAGAYRWSIVFVKNLDEARELRGIADRLIENDGILWLAYPKKGSKRYDTDITRDTIWLLFQESPVRPVAQVAIDDDWSALRMRKAEYVSAGS